METRTIEESNPYTVFAYAVRSPLTRNTIYDGCVYFLTFLTLNNRKHLRNDAIYSALIPILLPLKFAKVTLKIFKAAKATKFGYKIIQKIKKVFTLLSIFGKKIG